MRLVTGGIMHETHTFSTEPTPLEAYSVFRGNEMWSFSGSNHSVGGVIQASRDLGIDLVPTLFAHASPAAPSDVETFESLVAELVDRIADPMPVDGIVLTLHGAMVVEGYLDAEAEVLKRVRAAIGHNMPIAVTLDLHANIGQAMVDLSTIVVGYDTYPHIDAAERASEAVHLLARTINGEIHPRIALVKPPLIPVPQGMYTANPPMRLLFDAAHELERSGDALSVSIAGGFPYADAPETGMSMLVVTDENEALADKLAVALGELAWEHRNAFRVSNVSPADGVRQAVDWPEGPVILVDIGDNIGGGTPGDGTVLLAELLAIDAQEATVFIADPAAAERAFAVGVGERFTCEVGGKTDHLHGAPVLVDGIVRLLCDGSFTYQGPENAGLPATMGRTAVVRCGGVNVVLTAVKMAPGDLQQIKSVGIDPERQHIIVAKAAVRWRGGYAPISRHSIDVDTPGLGSIDLGRFEFRNLRRPLFPLDLETEWAPR